MINLSLVAALGVCRRGGERRNNTHIRCNPPNILSILLNLQSRSRKVNVTQCGGVADSILYLSQIDINHTLKISINVDWTASCISLFVLWNLSTPFKFNQKYWSYHRISTPIVLYKNIVFFDIFRQVGAKNYFPILNFS